MRGNLFPLPVPTPLNVRVFTDSEGAPNDRLDACAALCAVQHVLVCTLQFGHLDTINGALYGFLKFGLLLRWHFISLHKYTYGASANAGQDFPAKTTKRTEKAVCCRITKCRGVYLRRYVAVSIM